jgi:hypothetical protein
MLGYMLPYTVTDDYTLLYQTRDIASAGNWAQGGYTFRLYIDDIEAAVRTANFFDTMSMKILLVPILANYGGRASSCTGAWRDSVEWLIATYPVARDGIEYTLGPELDLTPGIYDLYTDSGMVNAWYALRALQTPSNDYTSIIGFIAEVAGVERRTMGWTCGLPATFIVEDCPSMAATIPHEIAHCYSIGDEYQGGSLNTPLNMPPYMRTGLDIFTRRDAIADNPNVLSADAAGAIGTGSVIYAEQRPYWAAGRQLLGQVSSYMGNAGFENETYWTSSEVYNHLFNVFAGNYGDYTRPKFWGVCPSCYGDIFDPEFYCECGACGTYTKAGDDPDAFTCSECGGTDAITWDNYYIHCNVCDYLVIYEWAYTFNGGSRQMTESQEDTYVKVIEITGMLDEGGAFLPSPWYTYDAPASGLSTKLSGEYSITFYDSGGGQVSVCYFDADFFWQVNTAGGQESLPTGRVPINIAACYPDGVARIVIAKGGAEIYSVNVSSDAPQVSFTGLSENQMLGDSVTLNWTASGGGGSLSFEIWYCPSEGNTYYVATNVSGNSLNIDLSEYPGTHSGYFQIYATDGVVTGEGVSPRIQVPYKAPIIIMDQDSIPEYRLTEEIWFDGEAYDLQDGWLYGDGENQAVWIYDGAVRHNWGSLWVWPYEFEPGLYTFTFAVTNSEGMTTQKDFTFRILDDESDLPDDWAREEIRNALANAFIVPLERLDAPITRSQYADIMANFFYYCLPSTERGRDPFLAYEEDFIKDCGWDDWKQFVMVYLGLMDAPDGIFRPAGSLTELEAASIMFRVVALADPAVAPIDATDDFILSTFYRLGVFNTDGPNAFNESETLTTRLALVRIWRFYDLLFN